MQCYQFVSIMYLTTAFCDSFGKSAKIMWLENWHQSCILRRARWHSEVVGSVKSSSVAVTGRKKFKRLLHGFDFWCEAIAFSMLYQQCKLARIIFLFWIRSISTSLWWMRFQKHYKKCLHKDSTHEIVALWKPLTRNVQSRHQKNSCEQDGNEKENKSKNEKEIVSVAVTNITDRVFIQIG